MSGKNTQITFADRHTATLDLMKCLKTHLQLSKAELARTATEIEEQCFQQSQSSAQYLDLVRQRCSKYESKPEIEPTEIRTTTGVADEPGAEHQDVGKFRAVFHERSLNAAVYKSKDPDTGQTIALKIVSLDRQAAPHDVQREAKLMRLVIHGNVISLLGSEPIAGGLFALKLPFMRFDLASLSTKGLFSKPQKQRHLKDLFTALEAVHSSGIIHRDIKPTNILLDSVDGPAYLTDFGISWNERLNPDEPNGQKITDVGTGSYRPPELLFGCKDYDYSLDMWAAGCTMAEILLGSGKTLFDAGAVTHDDFLGSDLTLLNSIFRKLGTPTDETWPEAQRYRDWGKITFKEFPSLSWQEMLPNVDVEGQDLVGKLVAYSTSQRFSANQVSAYCTPG